MLHLAKNELPSATEEDVLNAGIRWINYDAVNRKRCAYDILGSVRFKAITVRQMDNAISKNEPIADASLRVILSSIRRDLITGRIFK